MSKTLVLSDAEAQELEVFIMTYNERLCEDIDAGIFNLAVAHKAAVLSRNDDDFRFDSAIDDIFDMKRMSEVMNAILSQLREKQEQ